MRNAITRLALGALTAVLFLVFSIALSAQSRPAAGHNPTLPVTPGLNATVADLMRVVPATNRDLENMHYEGGKLQWVAFWRRGRAHRAQMTTSLRRNLQLAVPNVIHDVQVSGGSISSTFKLYKDLTVVCESLDSLLPPGSRDGKPELKALTSDLSDMNRIREDLSSYIQRTSASIESKNPQLVLSAGRFPKRIVIDDNVPDKPSARKRRSSNQ
jgi:hypothetical protein